MTTDTTPPYLHDDLASKPTTRIVEELAHRLRTEPKDTYGICPDKFSDLRHLIFEATP